MTAAPTDIVALTGRCRAMVGRRLTCRSSGVGRRRRERQPEQAPVPPELEQDQSTHVVVVEVDLERPGEGEEHLEAGVGASWVLADVSRDLIDGEFDLVAVQYPTVPKDPDGVAITRIFDALGGWTIEVHERRPRIRPEGSPGPDVPDVVLRARRRR